jgi:uncharacterized coiled-coil DUF342 family protein
MINPGSNCSRVDAVKATANQLQMQLDQTPRTTPASDALRKAQGEIQSLNSQIKSGDARKAETALSSAKSAVNELQTQAPAPKKLQRGLDMYG